MRQVLLFLFLFIPLLIFGKNPIGLPDIINYEKLVYGGGTQNWQIQQDRNGILYFANNEGLLTFDGTYWKIYPLPNKTIVRSLAIAADNKIYVGGQDEFGFFSPDQNGRLRFCSLKNKIPVAYRSFADIWDIVADKQDVFFRSEKRLFRLNLSDQSIKTFNANSDWIFLGKANGQVIAQDKKTGLLHYQAGKWVPFLKNALPPDFLVNSISAYSPDSILLASWQHGLFTMQGNTVTALKLFCPAVYANALITGAFRLNNNQLVISTNNNGLYIVNKSGSNIYNYNKSTGLQNNSVQSILQDNNSNIWLGLNNGIDLIFNNDAIKKINPEIFGDGVGHTSAVFQNNLYVGLSGAVFKIPLSQNPDLSLLPDEFTFVANTGGQAWGMNVIGNHLLLGKHEGAFFIQDNVAQPLATGKGYWNFLSYHHPQFPEPLVLAGNYRGIDLFRNINGEFKMAGSVNKFQESARFITVAENNLVWASHPYKGVYKIDLSKMEKPAITLYTQKNGLPSTYNNHVYKIKNQIVVSTEKGIYAFNPAANKFQPSLFYQNIFGNLYIRYLQEDTEGNIWFVQEKNLGVVDFSQEKPRLIFIPELNGKLVSGFEHINTINKNSILVGAQKGFYHINYQNYLQSAKKFNVQISLVRVTGSSDSLLFGGYLGEVNQTSQQKTIPDIQYSANSFHFEYSATINKNQSNIQYSYYLKGFDQNWSLFNKKTEKDYTNLPPGNYTFFVKARNNLGTESKIAAYKFNILPPWYRTYWAYAFYVLAAIYLIYYIYKRQQNKFIQQQIRFLAEQDRIKYLHQLELDKSEKEIVKLKNEKLETELEARNSELATTAMHLVQKAELLSKVKTELTRLNKSISDEEQITDLKKMIRLLTSDEKADEGWEQFSLYFDKVHTNFLQDLKSAYPKITTNDLRLSAYLKMNLSTKEIAQLMKISPRGVELSRYRLRKKLQVSGEVNLFEFFREFQIQQVQNDK